MQDAADLLLVCRAFLFKTDMVVVQLAYSSIAQRMSAFGAGSLPSFAHNYLIFATLDNGHHQTVD
jgi:hypothetical protein